LARARAVLRLARAESSMRSALPVGVVLVSLALASPAQADQRYPGSLTLEAAVAFDPGWLYSGAGLGAAQRLGVTLAAKRFHADDGVGQYWLDAGVGLAFFHYASCYVDAWGCSANVVFVPVGLRFGVGAVSGWSFTVDLGLGPYAGFLPNVCGASCPPGGAPSTPGVFPVVSLGGTVALGRHAELSFGLGIPTLYVGMAFL
jgi:hypothetical protein